jgi:hypothetical protein
MPKITEGTFALGGLATFAIWLVVILPFLYGPASHSSEQKHVAAERPSQSTNTKPDGSAAAPFVVQVIPSPKPTEERAQEAEEREEKKSADRWLVRWTAALFAATVGLILATLVLGYFGLQQSRDMKASIAVGKTAADAAMLSATSDRAWILPEKPLIGGVQDFYIAGVFQKHGIIGHLRWANFGRSPAMNARIFTAFRIIPAEQTEPVDFVAHYDTRADRMPIAVGVDVQGGEFVVNASQFQDFIDRRIAIVAFSEIRYFDLFSI